MKRKSFTLIALTAIIFLTLCSYDDGPWGPSGTNGLQRTGAAGTAANCSGSTCHGNNSSNTIVAVALLNGSTPVTSYIAGHTYNVKIAGSVISGNFPRYGFQLAAVKAATTTVQAGTFAAASGTAVRTGGSLGSLQIVEHTAPIAGTSSGSGWVYTTTIPWTAPAAGTGSVKFYLTLNAVNFDGHSTGDQANASNTTITENTTGIENAAQVVDVSCYPNPVTDQLHISFGGEEVKSYVLYVTDAAGRNICITTLYAASNTINTQAWSAGIYHLTISNGVAKKSITIEKQ